MAHFFQESVGFSYDDIMIVPERTTDIKHRLECTPFYDKHNQAEYTHLPIFAAPMTTVVDDKTYEIYKENKIIPIIPRSISYERRMELLEDGEWVAFSLTEFEEFVNNKNIADHYHILIDVANGHMKNLLELATLAKDINPNFKLMAGNIANPYTIRDYMLAGIDYVRVGIGTGSGCITTSNSGIHFPIGTLIMSMDRERRGLNNMKHNLNKDERKRFVNTKIIADGGIRNYDDVIKALVLGADYVMIGGLFASCVESPGDLYEKKRCISNQGGIPYYYDKLSDSITNHLKETGEHITENLYSNHNISVYDENCMIYKKFYGMASAQGQKDINGEKKKTSEGCEKFIRVNKTLKKWSVNMADYIKSSMSYLNIRRLSGFREAYIIRISEATKKSINK